MMPPVWEMMSLYLDLDQALAAHWWQALTRARGSEAVSLRQKVLWKTQDAGVKIATATPAELVHILGNLEREALVSHQATNTLIEAVLARTDAQGQWKAA